MHVEHIDSKFYRVRLKNALKMAQASPGAAANETAHLLELLLIEAGPTLNLSELEKQVRDATNLDLGRVREVADHVLRLKPGGVPLKDEAIIEPNQEVQRIDETLDQLAKQHVLAGNVAWFHLEFHVDRHLTRLLICAAHSGVDLTSVVAMASEKLTRIEEMSLVRLWSQIQREFDEAREARFDPSSSLLPPQFLELAPADELRQKIAMYV